MKLFIFAAYDKTMTHFEISAATPAEAIHSLVEKHGLRAYRLVNITTP